MWRFIIILVVLLTLVRVTLLLQQPPRVPVTSGLFQVVQVSKRLAHYHGYQIRSVGSKQRYRLRCFGDCPQLELGEVWQLYTHAVVSKRHSCYGLVCRYRPLMPVLTLNKLAHNQRIKPAYRQTQHERYLGYLTTWFTDPDTVAIFAALTLNDKRFFTRPIWQVFKRTGTSHLVAMSGLHVGLAVGLFATGVMRVLALLAPWLVSRYAAVLRLLLVVLMAGLLFSWISDSYSVERALYMILLSALVVACGGYIGLYRLLAMALWSLLLIDPAIVFSMGAWLSFFTVWVLLRYSKRAQDLAQLWVASPLRCGVIFLSLLPLCLYFFHSVSLLSPIINMLAVPWFSLTVIPLLVLSLFVSPVSLVLAKSLAWLAAVFFQPAYAALRWLSALAHGQWVVSQFSLLAALALVLLIEGGLWLIFNRSYGSMTGLVDYRNKRKYEHKQ